MLEILIESVFQYHSNLWPHANAGDKKWVTYPIYQQLINDRGRGSFIVLEQKEVKDVKEKEQEAPRVQENSIEDSPKTGNIKKARRSYPRKPNKKSVPSGEAEEPQVEKGKVDAVPQQETA